MIFITASPLLARNVSKLYHRVINYLKCTLRDKEKAAQEKSEKNKEGVSESTQSPQQKRVVDESDEFEIVGEESTPHSRIGDPDAIKERAEEDVRIVNEVMGDFDIKILEEAEKEIEQLLDDINLNEDQSEIPNTFLKVGIDDFPLFLTLKEFFYLMDSLMPNSFFARNVENMIRAGIKKTTGKKGFYRHKEASSSNRLYENVLYRDIPEAYNPQIEISPDEDEEITLFEGGLKQADKKEENGMIDNTFTHQLNSSGKPIVNSEDLITEVDYEDFKDVFYPGFLETRRKIDF